MRFTIAVYVENQYGVLTRVAGMFMRKGFNIDSLTVGETDDPAFSRITITMNGSDTEREQLLGQLQKLHNVKKVKLLEKENTVERELMLIKMKNQPDKRSEIMAAVDIYRAKVIDYTTEMLCIEVTGEPQKIKAFIEVMQPLGIMEICRTGAVALERGDRMLADAVTVPSDGAEEDISDLLSE